MTTSVRDAIEAITCVWGKDLFASYLIDVQDLTDEEAVAKMSRFATRG